MEEKLTQLKAKIEADKSFGAKLFSQENPQDVQKLLKEQGIDFSLDEIEVMKAALTKISEKGSDELSDEDLENVAGGSITVMAVVAIIGAIAGAVTAAGGVVDNAVRSRW